MFNSYTYFVISENEFLLLEINFLMNSISTTKYSILEREISSSYQKNNSLILDNPA